MAEVDVERHRCLSKPRVHEEANVGGKEFERVQRGPANPIRWQMEAPGHSREKRVSTNALWTSVNSVDAVWCPEDKEVDIQARVGIPE